MPRIKTTAVLVRVNAIRNAQPALWAGKSHKSGADTFAWTSTMILAPGTDATHVFERCRQLKI